MENFLASPAQRSPSPAAHPHAERRVTEVVDLTNDDEDAHNRHFVNPILVRPIASHHHPLRVFDLSAVKTRLTNITPLLS